LSAEPPSPAEASSGATSLPTTGPLAVYFPFADGALGYHCGECGYRCCRGAGFGATESELVQLSTHYPRLPMFVRPRREPENPLVGLVNFAPRCFFLKDDGHCRIEDEHGRTLKPYICRTFPANQLQRAGVFLIADLNFLCPLRPARPGDARIRHADVLADLLQSIEVPSQLPSGPEDFLPEPLLLFESHLRDLPLDEDLLRRIALSDVMAPRWERAPSAPSPAFVAAHRAYLVRLRAQMITLLGLENLVDPERAAHAAEMGVMLPRLRLQLLKLRDPQKRTIGDVLPELGRRMVALGVYLELMASLGAEITLGAIDLAFREGQLFLELLAMVDRVPLIEPIEGSDYRLTLFRTQESELRRLLQFVHDENPRRRLTLGQIFAELSITDPVVRAQICQSFTREALARLHFEAA